VGISAHAPRTDWQRLWEYSLRDEDTSVLGAKAASPV
jgi:hypothetical protein